MPELLGPNIADQMRGAVGVPVHVAIETGNAAARAFGTAVLGLIELLLRERRHQQAQSLELLGIQNPLEQSILVVDCHQFALGDIAQIRPRGQVNGWRKFRHEMVRQIKIEIETG